MEKVVNQLVMNMENTGGWGHEPLGPTGANELGYRELAIVSNFAIATFGMANCQGIKVPEDKINAAVEYVEKCAINNGRVGYNHQEYGQYAYVGRTAGALFAFAMVKKKDHPICKKMADIISKEMEEAIIGHGSTALSFFQTAIGSLQAGQETWDQYIKTWFPKILAQQNSDGSFKPIANRKEEGMTEFIEGALGPAYTTSLFSLILFLDKGALHFMGNYW
ncbi:MAG: hypothetical protein ABIH42_09045 [Planctomycetota bacterium]